MNSKIRQPIVKQIVPEIITKQSVKHGGNISTADSFTIDGDIQYVSLNISTTDTSRYPSCKLQGSNDNSTWVDLYERVSLPTDQYYSDINGGGSMRSGSSIYKYEKPKYNYYRIFVNSKSVIVSAGVVTFVCY